MNQRHYLLKGTFLLTLTGLLTRMAGFFYKIFLSRTIGAAEIGRFQLTLPVYAFCMALSCGGIQTAISRFTAEYYAEKDKRSAFRILACALMLSGGLSLGCGAALFFGSSWIAASFLLEPSCDMLLKMIALSLPFSAVHGCINGFLIGQKNVSVSAASQLLEQMLRIVSVFFFSAIFQKSGRSMDASVMALGQIAGEISAALFCMYHLFFGKQPSIEPLEDVSNHTKPSFHTLFQLVQRDMKKPLSVSMPLGINRMLICVLQGIEAALLPQMLGLFGHNSSEALAVYGTLTGMTMPLILFPTAVTGSLGTLLLPVISEDRALGKDKKIAGTISASFQGSLLLGYFFLTAFLLFGNDAGQLLFHSSLAGSFAQKLALICPFLYINTTLINILHGLGKTVAASVWNVIAFGIRLYFIIALVPEAGIDGYFIGMLLSQAFVTACSLVTLYRQTHFAADLTDTIIKPALICIVSGAGLEALKLLFPGLCGGSVPALLFSVLLYTSVFLLLALLLLLRKEERSKLLSAFRQRPIVKI
ncbi:MAG: polysaccharide biosynthesis protein [Lachnospiraceae bacterium]|nr:polysaccharide biosynthesis protein [Lachnospiraceae bacterium]